ncbi:MAG TPA: YdeI/OmpD-associated family protein [Bacteroidia bacterium]|nr:YdeI/OmpD-associated family protein [Bacteroidia bacterium]
MVKNKQIDAYIEKAQSFAKPVLIHIRKLVHTACPTVEEKIKWGFPNFDYKGVFCNMAGFKEHCSFGFWKGNLMKDTHNIFAKDQAMGNLGKLTSLKDLPSDKIMLSYIKQAVELNDKGVKRLVKPKTAPGSKELVTPDYLTKALTKNKKAQKEFEAFSYSKKKEYVDWLTEAKTEDTRNTRLETAVEWIAEGKSRNWKYMKK